MVQDLFPPPQKKQNKKKQKNKKRKAVVDLCDSNSKRRKEHEKERKKECHALTGDEIQEVQDFYIRDDISRMLQGLCFCQAT